MRNYLKSLVLRSRIFVVLSTTTYFNPSIAIFVMLCATFYSALRNNVLRMEFVSYYLSMHKLCKLMNPFL
jgi:hypothetical protein